MQGSAGDDQDRMPEIPKARQDEAGDRGGGWGRPMGARGEAMDEWRATLNEKGWVAPAWPKQYGGSEMDAVQST